MKIRSLILVWFFLSALGCSSGSTKKAGDILIPPSGQVYEHIACYSDHLITYALYLPKTAGNRITHSSQDRKFPVVLSFDPHGEGSLPVKKFYRIAEKYGFILVGSNNSRNMQSEEESEYIIRILFNEISERLPVDTSRIYLMGFSGGARVASLIAMFSGTVRGVIGCGAGFPSISQPPKYKFDYFGIVGKGDFNLGEMLALNKSLDLMNFRNFVLTFDGIHGWPSETEIEKAWQWHIFNAMKDKKIKANDSILTAFSQRNQSEYDSLIKSKNLPDARQNLMFRINCMDGLSETGDFRTRLAALEASKDYKVSMKRFNDVLATEQKEQEMLMDALYSKDLNWWKNRLEKYRDTKNPKLSPDDTLMYHRLLAFLGLVCYSSSQAMLKQEKREEAEKVLMVYRMTEPGNPEADYLLAVLYARKNDKLQTLAYLKSAFDKGFRDKNRITGQVEFEGIRDNAAYFDLLKRMP